jgi:hydrogenase nickel incorporation protein HypA/HybF
MHELSICQSLLDQVEHLAHEHQAQKVTLITLHLGPLAGVEGDLLVHAFTIARSGTVAAEAELVIETLPVRIRCPACGQEAETAPNQLTCPMCGEWRTEIVSGNEMLLAHVEMFAS